MHLQNKVMFCFMQILYKNQIKVISICSTSDFLFLLQGKCIQNPLSHFEICYALWFTYLPHDIIKHPIPTPLSSL